MKNAWGVVLRRKCPRGQGDTKGRKGLVGAGARGRGAAGRGAAGRGAASNGSGAPGGGGVVCQLAPGAHALGEGGPGAMDGRPGPKFSGRTAGAAFCPGLARDVAIPPPANAVGLVVDARDHARPVLGHGRMPPACPHGEEPPAQRAGKRCLRGRSFAGVPPGTLAPTRRERCGPHPARGGLPGLWRLGVGMKKGGPHGAAWECVAREPRPSRRGSWSA